LPQPLGQGQRAVVAGVGQGDRKFFAATPAQDVRITQAVATGLGKGDQRLIAHRMAIGVVDLFKVVDIQPQKRQGPPHALGVVKLEAREMAEMAQIGHPGEGITGGEVFQLGHLEAGVAERF
jgi:hypothetical protein